MVFLCQKNSFLTECKSSVVSCKTSTLNTVLNGKKTCLSGYDIILEDTVLFPEGGGQPSDYGYINDVRVENVRRQGDQAVHFTDCPLKEGDIVSLKIDWERRFDHMQQHSGQHLITAIADKEFGYSTTSWWLGQEISHIELDTPVMKKDEINKLEKLVNEYIQQSTPVLVTTYGENNPIPPGVRTRGLPEDHVGDVRVVTIEGLENNMCCGTHVTNLSQLQVIKLVKAEKGKKGKTNLEFLVGERVLKQLSIMYDREQALSNLLKNSPTVHAELIEKLRKSFKIVNKNLQSILKELAKHEAQEIIRTSPKPKYHFVHRQDADPDFMSVLIKEVNDEEILLFLTVGEDKGPGHMVLNGKPEIVSKLGPQISELLDGKGVAKGSKFQAKVKNLGKKDKANDLIRDYLNQL